jgi:isopenicillin-N epimerase
MPLDRRTLLVRTGLVLAAAGFGEELWRHEQADAAAAPTWPHVRAQFELARGTVQLGGFLFASHPKAVRAAIERHRRGLDADPVGYLHGHEAPLEAAVLREAARYLGADPADIALTDSTTMGLGLLYNGLVLAPGDEIVTTTHDFFATHESLRLKAARSGASLRQVQLYARPETATAAEIVSSLSAALTSRTRVVAITWVHSSTGVKLPIARLAGAVREANAGRAAGERILLCVDGVHGFGVEDATVSSLGCDFLVTGCHKWLLGPRGTGLVWGAPEAWERVAPTIPTFSGDATPGAAMTPGGFHPFEHRWALADAFAFRRLIGKARAAARIHVLNRRLKEGLAAMSHVKLLTPRADALSAGLVVFDVAGVSPPTVMRLLAARGVVGTVTPYSPSYPRLGAALYNTPAEVDAALRVVRLLR